MMLGVDDINRLEQENKELKEKITSLESEIRQKKMTIMMNNDHYLTVDKNNRSYRSALEEINITVKQLLQGVSSNCINNTPYLTALSLIENKINEVLKCKN